MTITLEKWGMTGFGEVVVGEGTGVGVRPGAGVDVCCATGVPATPGAARAGPAATGVAPPAAAGGEVCPIEDVGVLDARVAAPAEPDADGSGAGVARVPGDGVTTARVSFGKGAPHATSTRVQPN
ncbi:MAG TPA: hypothetical protein VGK51_15740, partial [Actinomycetota bacterium]